MKHLNSLINCCREASKIIEFYVGNVKAINADISSPVTQADLESNDLIVETLERLFPNIPVVSEERWKLDPFSLENVDRFWLVDPLDGTKEFLKNSGEYTINIALIEDFFPVFGMVHLPKTGVTYVGGVAMPASSYEEGKSPTKISVVPPATLDAPIATISKDHPGSVLDFLNKAFPKATIVHAGSALKFIRLAEGEAHLYPRMSPTMEWDTAAAQAVLEAAGGVCLSPDGQRLRYRKTGAHNGSFVAASTMELAKYCLGRMS